MTIEKEWLQHLKALTISLFLDNNTIGNMQMERIIERKRIETTQERRKGLILYLILFSTYLLILILWNDMDK